MPQEGSSLSPPPMEENLLKKIASSGCTKNLTSIHVQSDLHPAWFAYAFPSAAVNWGGFQMFMPLGLCPQVQPDRGQFSQPWPPCFGGSTETERGNVRITCVTHSDIHPLLGNISRGKWTVTLSTQFAARRNVRWKALLIVCPSSHTQIWEEGVGWQPPRTHKKCLLSNPFRPPGSPTDVTGSISRPAGRVVWVSWPRNVLPLACLVVCLKFGDKQHANTGAEANKMDVNN